MPCSVELTQAVPTRTQHRMAARTKVKTCPTRFANPPRLLTILPQSSRVVFCVSPICPTTLSIAKTDMKQPSGARLGRSFLHLMSWVAANHEIEGAVSMSAVDKNCRSTIPRNVNSRASLRNHTSRKTRLHPFECSGRRQGRYNRAGLRVERLQCGAAGQILRRESTLPIARDLPA